MISTQKKNNISYYEIIAYLYLISIAFYSSNLKVVFLGFYILLFGAIIAYNKNVYINIKYTVIIFIFYSFWFYLGLNNKFIYLDLIFHLFWGTSILIFYNAFEKIEYNRLFIIIFTLNFIIFLVYVLLRYNIMPNIYVGETNLPKGMEEYRVLGPTILSLHIIPLLYNKKDIVPNRNNNIIIYSNIFIGLITLNLVGNLQNTLVFIFLNYIALVKSGFWSNLFKIISFAIVVFLFLTIFAPAKTVEKFKTISNPTKSTSLVGRITDLIYMTTQVKYSSFQIVFGSGVGTVSEVSRLAIWDMKTISKHKFPEIDNGFFYAWHRTGFVGLALYLFLFGVIFKRIKNIKNRISFVVYFIITNLLSTHFFTHFTTALIVYVLVRRESTTKEIEQKQNLLKPNPI